MFSRIERLVSVLVVAGGIVSGLAIVGIVATMTIEVFCRYLLGRPTSWGLEVVSYFLVASACLGAAYTLKVQGHVAVDVLLVRLPPSLQRAGQTFALLVVAAVAGVLVWQGVGQVRHAAFLGEVSLTPLAVKMWMPLCVLPIGAFLLVLQAIVLIVDPTRLRPASAPPGLMPE